MKTGLQRPLSPDYFLSSLHSIHNTGTIQLTQPFRTLKLLSAVICVNASVHNEATSKQAHVRCTARGVQGYEVDSL